MPQGDLTFTAVLTAPPCARVPMPKLCITVMGGGELCTPQLPKFEDPLSILLRLIRGFSVFFLPLIPVLKILAALAAIKEWIVGLPQNIAQLVVFNPQPLFQATSKVITSLAAVVMLVVPQIAFCSMLRGILLALMYFLLALRNQLARLLSLYAEANAAIQKATALGNAAMLINAQCAKENLDTKLAALVASLGPVATVVAIVNIVLCLLISHDVKIPLLPDISDINAALIPIDAAITAIGIVLAIIPDVNGPTFEC